MKEKEPNLLQYQGYSDTESLFTLYNNPFSQSLFSLKTCKTPANIDIKENLMLGKRVEEFFKLQIHETKHLKILLENIQIQKEKRTIGELDFIIKDNNTQAIKHIEISYKFYLYDPNIGDNELSRWIGPNRNDDLLKKINKLSSHQFPMLFTPESKEKIKIDTENIIQEVFFKAQLYIPYTLSEVNFSQINPKAICGFYISFKDFCSSKLIDLEFYIPKKQHWLISPKENSTWHSFKTILNSLKETIDNKKSPLVWTKNKDGLTNRLFITWW